MSDEFASPAVAATHFAARLSVETDVADVAAQLKAGRPGLVLVDVRSREAWDEGHVPEAVHLPWREIASRAPDVVPRDALVVAYCLGPGCNGATKGALEFARLGYRVKEMIGGYEYWVREGWPSVSSSP
jgi:rhodanese-related sulfurtransferase